MTVYRKWVLEDGRPVQVDFEVKTSLDGIVELCGHEAIALSRYKDSEDIWTMAVGVTAAAGASLNPDHFEGELTVEQALHLFLETLPSYEAIADRTLGSTPATQYEYDALVSLCYNAGPDVARGSQTQKLIRQNRIADAIDLWRANKVLWSRRDREVRLARYGQYHHDTIPIVVGNDWGGIIQVDTLKADDLKSFIAAPPTGGLMV